MKSRLIALLLSLLYAGLGYGAHISDRLQAGFYAEPNPDSKPLQALPSGTPLEVLEEKDAFTRVRLTDNSEGWVASDFITDEKPVREQLLELQAKNGSLKTKLEQTQASLAKAQAVVKQLQERFNRMTPERQDSSGESRAKSQDSAATKDAAAAFGQQTGGHEFTLLHLSILAASIGAAFVCGILYRNNRLAKRFGGLRF